jgi:GT2 family glycosyltransferase
VLIRRRHRKKIYKQPEQPSRTMRVRPKRPVAAAPPPRRVVYAPSQSVPDVRLFSCVPYSPDGNLGGAYNRFMQLLPEDGWACFLDHDAIWTTRYWYDQIARAIASTPNISVITAVTNRIANARQRARGAPVDHDMRNHRKFGTAQLAKYGHRLVDITNDGPISGVVIVLSKAAWRACGPLPSGLLGVDNHLHASLRSAGRRVFLMPGLYVYHWYRGDGDKSHLRRGRHVKVKKWR